jgi:3-isopropylmalate dehydrogenase
MMFEDAFGLIEEAEVIKNVVNKSLDEGVVTEDLSGNKKAYKTSEVGTWLAENI